jgi:hypothetical protein
MSDVAPQECYQHLGFSAYDGHSPFVDADRWRALQNTQNLADLKERYQISRDCAGHALVDHGFVVGWVPSHNLAEAELAKLMQALDEGLAQGLRTVKQWQEHRLAQRSRK